MVRVLRPATGRIGSWCPGKMGYALVGELFAYVFIPAGAVVGIGFALYQWFLVSRVAVSPGSRNALNGGPLEGLLENEAEEGVDGKTAVSKCCEIQNAISVGMNDSL